MDSASSQPVSSSPSEAEETAGTDTEVSPAPFDHDDAALSDHPRLLACMRALLAGSVIALIVAVALFFAWNSGIKPELHRLGWFVFQSGVFRWDSGGGVVVSGH